MRLGFALACTLIFSTPTFALEPPGEWFIRQIAPQFDYLANSCGTGRNEICPQFGFEDITSWEDKHDSQVTYWSVTVVVSRGNTPYPLARVYVFKAVAGFPIQLAEMSHTFYWTAP